MKPTGNLVTDTICRTAGIGLIITGTTGAGTTTVIDVTPATVSNTCPGYEHPGKLRDHILRRLVDLPAVGFPSHLDVRAPRFLYTTTPYPKKIFQAPLACTDDGSKLTRRITRWILRHLAIDRTDVSTVARTLDIGWDLINQAALDVCRQLAYDGPHHLDGVRIFGVDGYVWKYTRRPGQPSDLVTVLANLIPSVDGRDPA